MEEAECYRRCNETRLRTPVKTAQPVLICHLGGAHRNVVVVMIKVVIWEVASDVHSVGAILVKVLRLRPDKILPYTSVERRQSTARPIQVYYRQIVIHGSYGVVLCHITTGCCQEGYAEVRDIINLLARVY